MDEVVSQIIMKATEVDSKTNLLALFALDAQLEVGADGNEHFLIGSVADMNLKPLLRCDSDINIMSQSTNEVTIPDGYKTPDDDYLRRLNRPSILLYRMQPTQDPGYVQLVTSGRLKFDSCTAPGRFVFKQDPNSGIIVTQHKGFTQSANIRSTSPKTRITVQHSSAFQTNFQRKHEVQYAISIEFVRSIPCPYWPSSDFHERPIQHNWPASDTIVNAVSMGCDLVLASDVNDRSTTDRTQWRLSFSRAETVLIQTWTPVQKIVYHLLRYFRRKCFPGFHLISSYHLKTLMLWNCEKQPPSYWKANVMNIASDLLGRLSQHVKDRWLSNYFIPQSNLFAVRSDEGDSLGSRYETAVRKLTPFTRAEVLAKWFLENYIKLAAEQFYGSKSAAMAEDLVLIEHMEVAELMAWLKSFFDTFVMDCEHHRSMEACMDVNQCIKRLVSMNVRCSFALDLCRQILDKLPKIDIRCLDFFRSVLYMQAASRIDQFGITPGEESFGLVTEVLIRSGKISRLGFDQREADSALSYLNKATSLLGFAKGYITVEEKLLLCLSKAYFWKALDCADAGSVYCAVYAYLAAIFYQEKDTNLALDCCRSIADKESHMSCYDYAMQPQLLPIINAVLLMNTDALKTENESSRVPHKVACKPPSSDSLTPEVFANRLSSKIHVESGRDYFDRVPGTNFSTKKTPTMISDKSNSSSQFLIDAAKNPNSSFSFIASKTAIDNDTLSENANFGISSNVCRNVLRVSGKKEGQEFNYSPSNLGSTYEVDNCLDSRKSTAGEFSFISENSRHINESRSFSGTDKSGDQIIRGHRNTLGNFSTKTRVYLRTESMESIHKWPDVKIQYKDHGEKKSKSIPGLNSEGTSENKQLMTKSQRRVKEMIYYRTGSNLNRTPVTLVPEKIAEKSKAYLKNRNLKDTLYSRVDFSTVSPTESKPAYDTLTPKAKIESDKNEAVINDSLPNTCTSFTNSKSDAEECTIRHRKSSPDKFSGSVAATIQQGVVSALVKAGVCHLTAFNKALQQDPEISQHGNCAYPYMALYHFNCGHFQAALEICNDMTSRREGHSSDAILFNLICSPPFDLLLTHELKMVVDECRGYSDIMLIDARVLAAYLAVHCLMNLDRSAVDVAKMLTLTYAILLHSHVSFERVTSGIYFLLREKVFQRYEGKIIEDMETNSLSVCENGVLTNVGIRHDGARITLYTERYSDSGSKDLFLGGNDKYISSHSPFGLY